MVVFRVDASFDMGSGHLARCLTLAHELKSLGQESLFICKRLKGNLIQQVVNAGFSVFVIDSDSSWQIEGEEECLEHCAWLGGSQVDDALQTAQVLKRTNASWLVVDHYAIGSQWHQVVRPFCDKILVIDDLGDRQLDCDVLLDPTLFAKPSKFENLTKAELLLGAEFAPLRSEFRNFRSSSLEYRDNGGGLNRFLITFGGADPKNLTESGFKALLDVKQLHSLQDIELFVILGAQVDASAKKRIHQIASCSSKKIIVLQNVNNMAEILANSDFVIGAAGSSSWERACLGVPCLQVAFAKNQEEILKAMHKAGAALTIRSDFADLDSSMELGWQQRRQMSFAARDICDGKGVSRVALHMGIV